jgi:hypothetical protein
MDAKTTFFNRNLTNDVYMTQPEGFVDPKHAGKICKLRSLRKVNEDMQTHGYGLK